MCNMTKNLRFKMKFKIPSFRSCCSSSKCLPILPSIYCLSPMNPKARDNSNAFPNLPPPPPPTPSSPDVFQYMVQNIISNRASSCNNPHRVHSESTFYAMDHGDSFNNKDKKVVMKSKGRTSISSSRTIANGLHNHHNHEKDMEEEEVSESLLSCYNSFSDEFCHNENCPEIPKTISQIEETRLRTFFLSKPDQVKVSCSRLPFFNSYKPQKEFCHSNNNPEIWETISPLENVELHTYTLSEPNQVSDSCTRMPYFNGNKQKKEKFANHGKKISNIEKVGGGSKNIPMKKKEMVLRPKMTQNCSSSSVEGIVKESYAVVKKSNDPYKDFKKSMMEMMMEMEMLKSEDMEQLLQCFLDLNSRCYHGVIVRAFMDIWQQLFSETCLLQKSQNN